MIAADVLTPIRDGHGEVVFLLRVTTFTDAYFKFSVEEVTAWDEDDNPAFAEPYVSGSLKFDGDMHLHFPGGYLYLASWADIVNHHRLLETLWAEGKRSLKNWCGT